MVFLTFCCNTPNLYAQNNRPRLDNDSIRFFMLKCINKHREYHGKSFLKYDNSMNNISLLHCKYMSLEKELNHEQKNELNPYFRGRRIDKRIGHSNVGENILYNWIDDSHTSKEIAEILFSQWRQSRGHNRNMLLDQWIFLGFDCFIGKETFPINPDIKINKYIRYKIYAVQVFSSMPPEI